MLPRPGVYYFPWEVSAGHVPDGGTLRTFGRLSLYDTVHSRATLTVQHGSEQHQVLVCTKLVEPFQAQVGALYVVLGELDQQKGLWIWDSICSVCRRRTSLLHRHTTG
ncbi:CST complex subunit TEN1 isoform X3 [Tupaia chinensis]|uniref:CST complex subunit TEN1 isoform X3 n=1 Tax=Tupaia chinensis TaxID=246437 RepID=UPI0003C9100D|nr:CST complex subunit TEN1 isoform X3 [Tupaia chinensis]